MARRTGEERFAAHGAVDDGRADGGGRVADGDRVWTEDALAERNGGVPVARRQTGDFGRTDQRVAVLAREVDFGVHFGVFSGNGQSPAFGDGNRSAVDRADDDLDAVRVAFGCGARVDARIVLLGVEDGQSILEVAIASLFFGPTSRIFPGGGVAKRRVGPSVSVDSAHCRCSMTWQSAVYL